MAAAGPGDLAGSWDAFFKDWVKPVVHFGTPALIVFAGLLTLARVLTRLMITKDTPGPRSADARARREIGGMYWLGTACLAWSAIEAAVVLPFDRDHPTSRPAPWTAIVSIGFAATAAAVLSLLIYVVGRPPFGQVFAPGLSKQERREKGLGPYARIGLVTGIAIGLGLCAVLLVIELNGSPMGHDRWLAGRLAPLAYGPLLAGLGIAIVGRTRGIGMGLLIQGHDKAGGDDAGLGAFVRARLYTLGSRGPSGLQVTQQTDVSTLPAEALKLIPEGIPAQLAALFVSLFTPATPWRVDVSEQADGSVVVSIQRNGTVASAEVIRASTLSLPDRRRSDLSAGSDAVADWTIELRTAAAAFILLTLSRRYYHLEAGLSGAKDWRSMALQVIATDPASHLDDGVSCALLTHAVAHDGENKAAELALLNTTYRTATDRAEALVFTGKLRALLDRLPNSEGMWPLRVRVRFNLIVAHLNYAAGFGRPLAPQKYEDLPVDRDVVEVRGALLDAYRQAGYLDIFWGDPANRRALHELWTDMQAAIRYATSIVEFEWRRRFIDDLKGGWVRSEGTKFGLDAPMTLLGRYEHACALVGEAATAPWVEKSALYTTALDELAMATVDPEYRTWARSDPSLSELHDLDQMLDALVRQEAYQVVGRFKRLIGDPFPPDLLALAPFADKRQALAERGVHNAAQLKKKMSAALASELGLAEGVASYWVQLIVLYERLERVSLPGVIPAAVLFLLIQAGLDSIEAVIEALRGPEDLVETMRETARNWAVVAPGRTDTECWRQAFGSDGTRRVEGG